QRVRGRLSGVELDADVPVRANTVQISSRIVERLVAIPVAAPKSEEMQDDEAVDLRRPFGLWATARDGDCTDARPDSGNDLELYRRGLLRGVGGVLPQHVGVRVSRVPKARRDRVDRSQHQQHPEWLALADREVANDRRGIRNGVEARDPKRVRQERRAFANGE